MKRLNINLFCAFILSMVIANYCLGNNFEELIYKCDFIKFQETYVRSNLSEKEKSELLHHVNKILEINKQKLNFFAMNNRLTLKDGNNIRFRKNAAIILSVIFGGLSFIAAYLGYIILNKKKKLSLQNTNANFNNANRLTNINRFKMIINTSYDKQLGFYCGLFIGSIFGSFAYGVMSRWFKDKLIIYKQYKKALKIKNLIQDSLSNSEKITNSEILNGV